ncbi:UTP--glucose-1-phosphate uridylyltransferase [Dictyocaulus viviparus]|uniref:UTP--glucose-1-phosphate uridylyltransferase n=1 Tax=Dictyocaulus viviparus TaxID=29172 RepID=A0A0D8XWQ5_DICVI|nr:UTP--glucose-1-phosphate uridylyltransferase [Dictyocaulus viviparus]
MLIGSIRLVENFSWYPPGHGNFYEALYNSGLLDTFIEAGKEYCFLSNIDNMGATVDFSILNFLLYPPENQEHPEFLMEVTNKTRADVKGGTLIQYEGNLMLLEIAQVPKEYVDEFKSISKFRFVVYSFTFLFPTTTGSLAEAFTYILLFEQHSFIDLPSKSYPITILSAVIRCHHSHMVTQKIDLYLNTAKQNKSEALLGRYRIYVLFILLRLAKYDKCLHLDYMNVNYRIFNTNNLWAKLSAIKRVVENNELEMEVIVNPKHLERGLDIIQLETAAGAAVKNFRGACERYVLLLFPGINVPRSRFLPVKKCSDLLLLMSNLYDIDHGSLTLSEQRSFPTTPLVKLGSSFDKVSDFLKRFQGIPDLLELDHLTVSGDVWFGKDVSLKGTVIIIANHGDRIDIPPGSVLENKIVSGNLRILEH